MKTKKKIIVINNFIFISCVLFSCTSKSNQNKENDTQIRLQGNVEEYEFDFSYDSLSSQFSLKFNDINSMYKSDYHIYKNGSLSKKTGLNFWGEEEKYFFDENGTLTGYRKLVRINDKRIGVQEFIQYKNGIIDSKKSHYFDFNIVDSSDTEYKIYLSYLGAFELDTFSVYVNDFAYQIDDLKLNKAITVSRNRNTSFWVLKDYIYDKQFDFFQININAFFLNDNKAMPKLSGYESGLPNSQIFILRKFKKSMIEN